MYICIKTNENLDKLIQELLKANLAIDVRRYDALSFISVNLKQYGYSAYVPVYAKELVIHDLDLEQPNVLLKISFEDLETIYDLD